MKTEFGHAPVLGALHNRKELQMGRKKLVRLRLSQAAVLLVLALASTALPGTTPARTGPAATYAFNLVEDGGYDSNGIPLNPRWSYQVATGQIPNPETQCGSFPKNRPQGKPACTVDKVWVDAPKGLRKFVCNLSGKKGTIRGHINWGPATFIDTVEWTQIALDGDYNWDLVTAGDRILTTNRDTLHTEAHGRETVNCFRTPWWENFHLRYHEQKMELVNGKKALITGLLNLDNVHGAYTELHPIYVFALLDERDCWSTPGKCKDTWVMFVRNWGNQGFCSRQQHYLRLPAVPCPSGEPGESCVALSVDLRMESVKSLAVDAANTQFRSSVPIEAPTVKRVKDGAVLRFVLPDASDEVRPTVHGELHIEWEPSNDLETMEAFARAPDYKVKGPPPRGRFEDILNLLETSASPETRRDRDRELQALESRCLDFPVPSPTLLAVGAPALAPATTAAGKPRIDYQEADLPEDEGRFRMFCSGARHLLEDATLLGRADDLRVEHEEIEALVEECRKNKM